MNYHRQRKDTPRQAIHCRRWPHHSGVYAKAFDAARRRWREAARKAAIAERPPSASAPASAATAPISCDLASEELAARTGPPEPEPKTLPDGNLQQRLHPGVCGGNNYAAGAVLQQLVGRAWRQPDAAPASAVMSSIGSVLVSEELAACAGPPGVGAASAVLNSQCRRQKGQRCSSCVARHLLMHCRWNAWPQMPHTTGASSPGTCSNDMGL